MVACSYTVGDPTDASALGDNILLLVAPTELKLVYLSAVPLEDDTGATLDLDDDGTVTAIAALAVAVAATPGTWSSTHFGGSNAPITFAKGSEIGVDINAAAAGNFWNITLWFLPGA
jgi:hypothetical protein